MKFNLQNKKSTIDVDAVRGSVTISSVDGVVVIESGEDLYKSIDFIETNSIKMLIRKTKQFYDLTDSQFESVVSAFGGKSFVDAELNLLFKSGLILPVIMFLIGISFVFDDRRLILTDYLIVFGSCAHFALSLYGRTHKSPKLFLVLASFNLYYCVFWFLFGIDHGWGLAGVMIGLMIFLFMMGKARFKLLEKINKVALFQ